MNKWRETTLFSTWDSFVLLNKTTHLYKSILQQSTSSERMELKSNRLFKQDRLVLSYFSFWTKTQTVREGRSYWNSNNYSHYNTNASTYWDADHLLLITVRSFKWDVNVFSSITTELRRSQPWNKISRNMKDMSSDGWEPHEYSELGGASWRHQTRFLWF